MYEHFTGGSRLRVASMDTGRRHGAFYARILGAGLAVLLGIFALREIWLASQYQPHMSELTPPVPFIAPKPAVPSTSAQHADSEHNIINDVHDAQVNPENEELSQILPSCADPRDQVPGAEKVMIVLKTGATELYQKLPMHFVTTFKCIPKSNILIASDLEQSFAGFDIFDAIASISERYLDHHPDFELYRQLQKLHKDGQDTSNLKGDVSWNLDKWKFLPILHRAHDVAEDGTEWFVFIEADTSISWTNLLQWLDTMDSNEPLYLGSQNFIGSTPFAHGGSGIVLSRKALELLEELRRTEGKADYDARWEDDLVNKCCGDEAVGRAFLEANVELTPAWPPIQGETVASLDWTDRHWCSPAISWHHVSPQELDAMWQFDRAWVDGHGWNEPYLYRDVFAHFVERHVSVNKTKWNNFSKDKKILNETLDPEAFWFRHDVERLATESPELCAEACVHPMYQKCVQWMYSLGRCHLGYEIRLGQSDEREEEHWTSGWIQEKLEKFKYKHRGCKVNWSGAKTGDE